MLRRNKGRDSKLNKKCTFLGGKPVLFVLESKEKETNNPPPNKNK